MKERGETSLFHLLCWCWLRLLNRCCYWTHLSIKAAVILLFWLPQLIDECRSVAGRLHYTMLDFGYHIAVAVMLG